MANTTIIELVPTEIIAPIPDSAKKYCRMNYATIFILDAIVCHINQAINVVPNILPIM